MSDISWTLRAAFAVTASGLALAGCSSGSSSDTPTAEVTVTETAAASPAETPAQTQAASTDGLPAPPAGAKQIDEEDESGMVYARYKVAGTSAQTIVDDYESELKDSGYQ